MSRARRLLLLGSAGIVVVLVAAAVLVAVLRGHAPRPSAVPQDRPGPVLLVPGYGGDTTSLSVLARVLEASGRRTQLVALPGDGTGDLTVAAGRLRAAADAAVAAGAPSVDVVGYSAGGVIARLWARDGGWRQARRIVTLGSPHHGTQVAALGAQLLASACPEACRQLVPGSQLLDELNGGDETPDGPQWLSLWSQDDQVVTPPSSADLQGARDVALQQVCPGLQVSHGQLPRSVVVQAVVAEALATGPVHAPGHEVCTGMSSLVTS